MTGRNLTQWRERLGMSIEQAAFRYAIPLAHWVRWESRPDRKLPRGMIKVIEIHESISRPPTGPPLPPHSTANRMK